MCIYIVKQKRMVKLKIKSNLFGFRVNKEKFIIAIDKAIRNWDGHVQIPMYDFENESLVRELDIEINYNNPKGRISLFIGYDGDRVGIVEFDDGNMLDRELRFIGVVRVVTDICDELSRQTHITIV